MFEICSHSRLRAFLTFGAAAGAFFLLAALLFALLPGGKRLARTEGRCAYLASLGLQAVPGSEELREIVLPEEFDAVLEEYNSLQLSQGFDLRVAAGKRCLCCSYDLVGYPGWEGRVIATIYIFRGRVIGGDIHTAAAEGFLRSLR